MNYKAYIFDYDGVIAESNEIKTLAFEDLFSDADALSRQEFVSYHLSNEGISRIKKIEYFYGEILKINASQELISDKANEFSNIVKNKVISCQKVDGIYEFLEKHSKDLMLFISTGTPTEEILEILDATNMKKYFKSIYGSPQSKEDHICEIMSKYCLTSDEIIFIGDSQTDLRAARHHNLRFVLRTHTFNQELSLKFKGDKIRNFAGSIPF